MTFPGLDLAGRTAAVIGGTSGIGRAIALGLADAGADVIPTGRRAKLVEEVAREIESKGRRSFVMTADVANTDSIQGFADASIKKFGKIDILVNVAGITV
jgi:NAD(P)-dependent dehydrogenase (short-subunit alcohol dehydrogenase family)